MVHNHIVIFAARILGTATGLLFLYGACFLYPDERKLFQSRAEDWWIELDELRSRAVKGEPAFICWIATTAHKGFYWLFGEPLSSKFFIVSGLLSMTSFAFTMMTFGGYSWAVPTGLLIFAIATILAVLHLGRTVDDSRAEWERDMAIRQRQWDNLLASLRSPSEATTTGDFGFGTAAVKARLPQVQTPWAPPESYLYVKQPSWKESLWKELVDSLPLVYTGLLASPGMLLLAGARGKGVGAGVFVSAITTSFFCDVVAILVTMVVLEKLKQTKSRFSAAGWLLLNAAVTAAMLGIPFTCFWWWVSKSSTVGRYLLFVASANISTAAPAAAYVLLAMGLVLHRLFWPLLLRPLYNLIGARKFLSPKVLGTAGVAMLIAAWPQVFTPLRPIVKALTDLL